MPVNFSDLQLAFEFVSSGSMGENEAFLDRQSGKIYWHSEVGDTDEELPDDIDDEKYISIPDKRELDLGKPLVLDFAREFLPDDYDEVAEVARVDQNGDGIISAAEGDIDTASDSFPNNERLFLPPTVFNRFAVTREINDGLLAPRFAPSQRAWVLSGVLVPVSPTVDASTGRDADDR